MSITFWKKQKDPLAELETKQAQAREHIKGLRKDMEELVEQAVDADDLKQKQLSVDYECLREEMNAANRHFGDLNRIVSQMRTGRIQEQEMRTLKEMQAYQYQVDLDGMARNSDYIAACREVAQEEQESLDRLSREQWAGTEPMLADAEFLRRVALAREQRAAEKVGEKNSDQTEKQ